MRVLLATDGSRYSARAARFIGDRLLPEASVEIEILAVGRAATDGGDAPPPPDRGGPERWVEEAASILRAAGLPANTRVAEGDPAEILVRESAGSDLVVAGVKGRGAGPFFELGSTALALLRESEVSVLLVRPGAGERRGSDGDPGDRDGEKRGGGPDDPFRVLLPTDGMERDLAAAWELLGPFAVPHAEVEVLTVMEPSRVPRNGGGNGVPWAAGPTTEVRSRARKWLQGAVHGLQSGGAAPRTLLLEGRPAREIGRRAREGRADLIILGCRGNGRPPGPLGRTARELTWSAPCSVLLVRGR